MKRVPILLGVVVALAAAPATAAIIVDEDFTHVDGPLVGQTPTPGPGGIWAAHSGAGNKVIQVLSGSISLNQSGGSGEDVNTGFTAMAAGDKLYAGFDVTLPSGQTVNPDGNGLYFAHFMTGTSFRARVFVASPLSSGDFILGFDADGSTPTVFWPIELNFDTTYRIIVSYDFDTGNAQLWIDASLETDPSIIDALGTSGTTIDGFAFRQSSDYTGRQVIDNLVVSDSFPEAVPVELMSFSVE